MDILLESWRSARPEAVPAASWHIVFHDTTANPSAFAPASSIDLPASPSEI